MLATQSRFFETIEVESGMKDGKHCSSRKHSVWNLQVKEEQEGCKVCSQSTEIVSPRRLEKALEKFTEKRGSHGARVVVNGRFRALKSAALRARPFVHTDLGCAFAGAFRDAQLGWGRAELSRAGGTGLDDRSGKDSAIWCRSDGGEAGSLRHPWAVSNVTRQTDAALEPC